MEFNTQGAGGRQQDFFAQTGDVHASETPEATENNAKPAEKEKIDLTFEQALARLEQTVARLESTDVTLDESLRLFQDGTKLSRVCSELLENIEQRITQLVGASEGEVREIPFDED